MSEAANFNIGHCSIRPGDLEALKRQEIVDGRLSLAGLAAMRCLSCHVRSGRPTSTVGISDCAGVARATVDNQVRALKNDGSILQMPMSYGQWSVVPGGTERGQAFAAVSESIPPPPGCVEEQAVLRMRSAAHG